MPDGLSTARVLIRQLQGMLGGNRIVRGIVNADGTIAKGTGFTITKGAAGVYTVNFDPAFSDTPSVVAMTVNTVGTVGLGSASASAAVLATNAPNNTLSNQPFHFIAVGP